MLDIVKALEQRASVLENELSKVRQAIRALNGTKIGLRGSGRKWHHTPAPTPQTIDREPHPDYVLQLDEARVEGECRRHEARPQAKSVSSCTRTGST
jgi:hypothetical protein